MKPTIYHIILLIGLILTSIIPAQGQILRTKNWHFGYNTSLRFETDTVIVDTSAMQSGESCASISDEQGNLLLYTDGITVWNKKHQIIGNGAGLLGHESSSDGVVFIPIDQTDSIIYLFTTDYRGNANGFRYNTIRNFGNDSFVMLSKNNFLFNTVAEPIGAVKHHDNNRNWVMVRQFNGYNYLAYLVDKNGVLDCPVISKTDIYIGKSTDPSSAQNNVAFSPNGLFFAGTYSTIYKFDFFSFNSFKGKLENPIFLDNIETTTGVQFSANAQFLYLSKADYEIIQFKTKYSTKKGLINDSYKIPNVYNNKFDLKLTPKQQMLIIQQGAQFYGKIANPDSAEGACNYQIEGMPLGKAKWDVGLPNFNYSYFYTPAMDFSYEHDCQDNQFSFIAQDTFVAYTYNWSFIHGSTTLNQSGKKITLTLADTGNWQIQLIASNGQRSDTIIKKMEVFPLVVPHFLGPDTAICQGNKISHLLKTPPNMHCIHWMGEAGQDYENYHADSLLADTTGIYFVKITNKAFCTFYDTLQITAIPLPEKPIISYQTKELASTIKATSYRWFLNDTLLVETQNRSIVPLKNGFYRLQFINMQGCQGPLSDTFWVGDVGALSDLLDAGLKIYPNPSQGQLTIEVNQPNYYTIEIIATNGKIISKEKYQINKTQQLNLQLPPGHYYLRLSATQPINKFVIKSFSISCIE